MLDKHIRAVPVVDDGVLVGVMSRRGVLRCVARRELTSAAVAARRMHRPHSQRPRLYRLLRDPDRTFGTTGRSAEDFGPSRARGLSRIVMDDAPTWRRRRREERTTMRHTTVGDVMSTPVVTVEPHDSFSDVAKLLYSATISAVPVVHPDGAFLGVVSDADLMATAARLDAIEPTAARRPHHTRKSQLYAKVGATTAEELMTTQIETVTPQTGIAEAARTMLDHELRWMPVVDDGGRVIGVLSRSDTLAVFLHSDASIRAEVLESVRERIPHTDPPCLEVEVHQGVVTLTGVLETLADVESVVGLTGRIEGVVSVVDRLRYRVDERLADS
jgi:CBS domain-containing protein